MKQHKKDESIEVQQKQELISNVRNYFPEMQKSFVDNVFKQITWCCKNPREDWIDK